MTAKQTFRLPWSFLNPFDIRKGEWRKTLLMFSYFFLTMVTLYVLKPVRSSLFLEELGSGNLRFVYLGEGILLFFATWAYVYLAKRLPKKVFFPGVLFIFISNLLIFWWLFHSRVPYLSAFFYVWVACFSITVVTQFWTLANDLFNPLEAKRLFGLIISGGSAGGILGGLLTNRAVQWLRTEDLLLICSALLGGCVYLISLLWQEVPAHPPGSSRRPAAIETRSARKIFLNSPYLWMLAGIVLLAKVASTMVDNQFNAVVELYLHGKQAKTAFFGAFSAGLNVISLLLQLCATSLSLRFLGIGISLTLLPAGLGLVSLVTFFYPLLATGTFLKIFDGSMNYSVQQASKEVLYLPLSSGVRYRVKPVIDMLIYRASKSFGGLLIILLAPLFGIPNEKIGILVIALIPVWIYLVWRMRAAYLLLLGHHLREGKAQGGAPKPKRATEVLGFLYDEKSFEKLRSFLTQESTVARKMAAAACLVYHRAGKDLQAARRLVGELIRLEALEAVSGEGAGKKPERGEKEFLDELLLREAEKEAQLQMSGSEPGLENPKNTLERIQGLLRDPEQPMALKREAARILEHRPTQEAADGLLEILKLTEDHSFRFLLIRTLLRMGNRNPEIRWNRPLIKKEIQREAGLYRKIRQLYYFHLHSPKAKKDEFLEVVLAAISEESLERLFWCLRLLYEGEAVQIIYESLLGHPSPDPVRSHAVELLQNILGPEFSGMIQEIFDEETLRQVSEEEAVVILGEMISSSDRWLSLAAHFLGIELGLAKSSRRLGPPPLMRSFESLDL